MIAVVIIANFFTPIDQGSTILFATNTKLVVSLCLVVTTVKPNYMHGPIFVSLSHVDKVLYHPRSNINHSVLI